MDNTIIEAIIKDYTRQIDLAISRRDYLQKKADDEFVDVRDQAFKEFCLKLNEECDL